MKTLYKISLFVVLLASAGSIFAQTGLDGGIELFKKGDYSGAARVLKQASKKDSANARVWYFLGISYLKQDEKKEAQKALEKSVAINEKDADAQAALAYVLLLRNNLKEAQARAREAARLAPKNAEAHYILGTIDYKNGSFDAALENAKKAIEADAAYAPAYELKSESLISSFVALNTRFPSRQAKKTILTDAVAAWEKYLSLSPGLEVTEYQREFLESLKFFAEYYSRSENKLPINAEEEETNTPAGRTPLKIISKKPANYTNNAREARISGTVRLLVGFSADGTIKHTLVIKSLDSGLNREAVKAARQIKFEPAMENGKPVSTVKLIEYTFSLY